MPPILIRLNDRLFNAGMASTTFDDELQREVFEITPPETPLFDQIVDYLNHQPDARYRGDHGSYLGVGMAALCVRWGSYLATLMDPNALPHPSVVLRQKREQDQCVSWIDDAEMKRLNLEISYGLARLCRLYHDDCEAYLRLIAKAYHYLPMPNTSAILNKSLNEGLWQAQFEGSLKSYMKVHPASRAVVMELAHFSDSYDIDRQNFHEVEAGTEARVVGNFLANFAWRNTSIERFHSGQRNPVLLTPHERRFTLIEERRLLKELSGNMLVVDRTFARLNHVLGDDLPSPLNAALTRYPENALALRNSTAMLWYYTYPGDWSLTENASVVRL